MSKATPFGHWLKQRRKVLGLTQKELAQKVGCAEITLRKIETGSMHPSALLAASLAKAVGAADADVPCIVTAARRAGGEHAPPARWSRPQRPNNLVAQLTHLIGRERDITAVRKRLLSDGARLITLLGPPGVGKTRLAQAVAEDVLDHFEHGVFFVRLAPIGDPDLAATAIARALELPMNGPNPPALQLRAFLEEKHLLLVLDNFEQIVAAAPLVDDMLRRCPWLHVLVTSRQSLRVRGERQMTVHPLPLPTVAPKASPITAEDMLRYPAVALFADRAEAVQADFAVDDDNAAAVAELCRRLDGLPLAIELVAARVKLLPPAELLARLRGPWLLSADGPRDVSVRQKTLRGAVGWSYNLLTPAEQTLFTRLAVFAGGCTLEAARILCEDVLPPAQVLDGIASLLDKSLLHSEAGLYGEQRYVLLETIREYGLERVAQSGQEADLRQRHARCFQQLVENAEKADPDPSLVQVRHLIDDDINNMRAAFAWAMKHDIQAALLLSAPLLHWFGQRGPFAEGRRLMDLVLALPGASAHTIPRVKALLEAGILLHYYHEEGLAQTYEEEAIAIGQELEYGKGVADALLLLGRIAMFGWADQEAARQYFEQSTALYIKLDNPGGASYALALLADVDFFQTDYPRARALAKESLAAAQRAGFHFPYPLGTLGAIAYAEGDLERAKSLHEQRLAIERQRGEVNTYTLTELATVAIRQRDFPSAHVLLNELLERVKGYGYEDNIIVCQCYLLQASLAQAEGDYDSAVRYYWASLPGIRRSKPVWSAYGLDLVAMSMALNQHELGARLLGVTEVVDKTGFRLMPIQRKDYNRLAEAVRAHLGTSRFDAAWTEGRARGFELAVEEAITTFETLLSAAQVSPEQ